MIKKMIAFLAFSALIATTAHAQGDPVTSVNAVGMVKNTINPNVFSLIQIPFIRPDGSNPTPENTLNQLPVSSKVYIWNSSSQSYTIVTKANESLWLPQNQNLGMGDGFFVLTPNGSQEETLVVSGEVPGSTTYSSVERTLNFGFNLLGSPFPVDVTIENSPIDNATVVGDKVYIWDNENGGYTIVTKATPTLWLPQNQTIKAGQAVFILINNAAANPDGVVMTENAPYTFPSN